MKLLENESTPPDDILARAKTLIGELNKIGIKTSDIYVDPLDKKIMASIRTADMLLGQDQYCMQYLKRVRSGAIES